VRFGLPEDQRDAFIAAYGHDIRSWAGYPALRDIRELSTLSALLRDGHIDPRWARAADQVAVAPHRRRPAMDPLLTELLQTHVLNLQIPRNGTSA
jgi:hypothetical protein